MALGAPHVAARAGPPSPLYPRSPVPAKVDTIPFASTCRTPLPSRSQIYVFRLLSLQSVRVPMIEACAAGVDLEGVQVVEGGLGCRAAVSGVALTAAARDGHDDPGIPVDAADGVVAPVANVEVAQRIEVTPVCFAD